MLLTAHHDLTDFDPGPMTNSGIIKVNLFIVKLCTSGFCLEIMIDVNEHIDLPYQFKSCEWNPLFLHFTTSAVTHTPPTALS
jgi:hypothetical protein